MNERKIAANTLYEIRNKSAYINIALSKTFEKHTDLKANEKGLVTELVHGVTERAITLDYIVSEFSSVKLNKIAPKVLICLELGIYQLLYMDKIPESAAVNESVKLAKMFGGQRSGGFVNAVLRSVIRNKENIAYPKEKNAYLSVYYSYPLEIVDLFLEEFGYDFTKDLLESFYNKKSITLRCNMLKTTPEKLKNSLLNENIESVIYKSDIFPELNCALTVDKINDIEKLESYINGEFYIQDIAAMMVTEVLAPKEGNVVLDMCASPGGKTTHIAEKMNNSGKVFAFDVYEHKIKLIEENAKRLGINICSAKMFDSMTFSEEYVETADCVLVDAPCSGFGILGKKPDIKYHKNVEDVDALAEISIKILDNASKYVKHGGTLVFSTCTILKKENECVVDNFLKNHEDFYLEPIKQINKENEGFVTLYPNVDNTDGFFICKLKKR